MNHEESVRKVLSSRNAAGALKSRESNTVEFKESFNKNSTAKYAKTMAAYSTIVVDISFLALRTIRE